MKKVFIVNPTSGGGHAEKVGERIEKYCTENEIDFSIHYTTRPNEATDMVKNFKNKEYIIYSVGGDGTLNEVLNGMIKTKNKLAIIPAGTGNDFYRTLEKYDDGDIDCDVGCINNRFFINIASIGLDAELSTNAIKLKGKFPRTQVYNASLIYTFFSYKFRDMEFILDGIKKKDQFTIVTVCNGISYGGGFKISPNSIINDGLFDICFVDKLKKLQIPKVIGLLAKGEHLNHPSCHMKKSKAIKMHCDTKIPCQVDGETFYANDFDVKMYSRLVTLHNDKNFVNEIMKNM